jgi:glycine/D-amino acid oxidase-like deaminating enzyme
MTATKYDVAVIGGGFYGCFVAYQIAANFPELSIVVLEKEESLFSRASGTNQGQLHLGYMYSADVELAAECARNARLFEEHFPAAIDRDVTCYFGIHRDSEIDPAGYENFCAALNLPVRPAPQARRYFGDDVVATYGSAEQTFNGVRLGAIMRRRMTTHGVAVRLRRNVHHIAPQDDGSHAIVMNGGEIVTATTVYNTTFADINLLHARSRFAPVPIRSEVFLHFLLRLPAAYTTIGIAVIRGRFASALPSTSRGAHLLAAAAFRRMEVSDTVPLSEYVEDRQIDKTHAEAIRECSAYLPVLRDAVYQGHVIGTRAAFIDVATNETTSRVTPILDFTGIKNYHVILGGKVTCLFEALEPALAGVTGVAGG